MKIHNQDAAVFFGPPDAPLPDWRKGIDGDVDPDDEELDVTPADVVAVLGFDPKEFGEIGEKAFCPTGPGGGVDNSCSPKAGLLLTAINKLSPDDVPDLDWSHVSDLARWDDSRYTAALVDRAYQPTNEAILEEAQLNYSRHAQAVDDDDHLKDRIRSVMTDAAAHLVHLHAIELKEQDEKEASDKWWATKKRISQAVATAESALEVTFQEARSGSAYATYDAGDISLKLRISDHHQRPGGGFNEGRGERMGEADVEWVVSLDDPMPTKMDYRHAVAVKLRELRE